MAEKQSRDASDFVAIFLKYAVVVVALSAVVFVMAFVLRIFMLSNTQTVIDWGEGPLSGDEANVILDRAQDAVSSAELVLSFLEGASVVIGLGFAAATLYGLRNTQEIRTDLQAEVAKVEAIRQQLDDQVATLHAYRPYLENLQELRSELQDSQVSLENTIENVQRVFQADQEFRLRNYHSAYRLASQVLANDPDNRMALYIAGWLEVQHLPNKLESGIGHLEHVVDLESNWPAAKAAYGVALRRKARGITDPDEREDMFLKAEGILKTALAESPRLLDFEGESFWGPVGGILREMGRCDSAIQAYEKALDVTPDSSYPWGNLATLYLKQASENGNAEYKEKSLKAYERTVITAKAELVTRPNNFYLLMDIAQSASIIGHRDAAYFNESLAALNDALTTQSSSSAIETSMRGWNDLLAYCPEDWDDVHAHLTRCIATIQKAARKGR